MLRHYYALHPDFADGITVRRRPTLAQAAPQLSTAAAVTGHAAAAGTVVLCVSRWNRIRSFLYTQGLMRLQQASDALRAIGSAPQRVAPVLR